MRVVGFVALLAALLLCGCSGGGVSDSGRATLTVRWPERSRLIPFASDSIRVNVTKNGQGLGTALLVRPAGGGNATATFDRLPVGEATVSATALPGADGSGIAQASASVPVTVVAGQTASVRLTMASTIASLSVSPSAPNLTVGQTATLTVTPKNAAGETVLVSPSTLTYATNNASVATVDGFGTVTAAGEGSATITVTETESGKQATAAVTALSVPSYEGFAYTSGSSLVGAAGGSGWSDAWALTNGPAATVTASSLTFGGLRTTGGGLFGNSPDAVFVDRNVATPLGQPGTVRYVSLLARADTVDGFDPYFGAVIQGEFFGKVGHDATFGLENLGGGQFVSTDLFAQANRTYFLVLRVTFGSVQDRFELWIDPTPGAPLPSVPKATQTVAHRAPSTLIRLGARYGCTFDELRVGPTWESVSPL